MCALTTSDRNKLGNAVIYIASHTTNLSKTKLLKLLYFMEEYSVRRFHTPFLGLPFEVWQAGPVVKDIFIDLSENPVLLDGFIIKRCTEEATYIHPAKDFCDEEFSDNDMVVMDDVLKKYAHKTAKELVLLTHRTDSLWYKIATEEGLLSGFENKLMNNSDYTIDFSDELPDCSKDFYKEQLEFLQTSRKYAEK